MSFRVLEGNYGKYVREYGKYVHLDWPNLKFAKVRPPHMASSLCSTVAASRICVVYNSRKDAFFEKKESMRATQRSKRASSTFFRNYFWFIILKSVIETLNLYWKLKEVDVTSDDELGRVALWIASEDTDFWKLEETLNIFYIICWLSLIILYFCN